MRGQISAPSPSKREGGGGGGHVVVATTNKDVGVASRSQRN